MNRVSLVVALAMVGLGLGACASAGRAQPVTLSELAARCEAEGGVLVMEASHSRQAATTRRCHRGTDGLVAARTMARTQLSTAVDRSLGSGL